MINFFARKGLNILAIKDASHANSEYTGKRPLFGKENNSGMLRHVLKPNLHKV